MLKSKAIREKKGLTQVQVAEEAGITAAYLCELETGVKVNPGYNVLVRIAAALGVTVAELLGESDNHVA